jgi:hypothetical protein
MEFFQKTKQDLVEQNLFWEKFSVGNQLFFNLDV